MNFLDAIDTCVKKYVKVEGRASRPEYWYWVLFVVCCSIVTTIADVAILHATVDGIKPFTLAFKLATFIPGITVGVRRLHDIDRKGWWLLIPLTIIGIPVLIYFLCQKGTPGPNKYGEPVA